MHNDNTVSSFQARNPRWRKDRLVRRFLQRVAAHLAKAKQPEQPDSAAAASAAPRISEEQLQLRLDGLKLADGRHFKESFHVPGTSRVWWELLCPGHKGLEAGNLSANAVNTGAFRCLLCDSTLSMSVLGNFENAKRHVTGPKSSAEHNKYFWLYQIGVKDGLSMTEDGALTPLLTETGCVLDVILQDLISLQSFVLLKSTGFGRSVFQVN